MAVLQVNNDKKMLRITQHLNNVYRLIGAIVLLGSLYMLLYPEITGRPIIYRGDLDVQFFSIPGFILSSLAFTTKRITVDRYSNEIIFYYGLPFLFFYKKSYPFSLYDKILLGDWNEYSSGYTANKNRGSISEIPWYVACISPNEWGLVIIVAKSTNSEEVKNIAEMFSEATKIPLEVSPHYPANP